MEYLYGYWIEHWRDTLFSYRNYWLDQTMS